MDDRRRPNEIPPEENCDVWGVVDFGQGPVNVRCTQTGQHRRHRCEVRLGVSYERPDGA